MPERDLGKRKAFEDLEIFRDLNDLLIDAEVERIARELPLLGIFYRAAVAIEPTETGADEYYPLGRELRTMGSNQCLTGDEEADKELSRMFVFMMATGIVDNPNIGEGEKREFLRGLFDQKEPSGIN